MLSTRPSTEIHQSRGDVTHENLATEFEDAKNAAAERKKLYQSLMSTQINKRRDALVSTITELQAQLQKAESDLKDKIEELKFYKHALEQQRNGSREADQATKHRNA
jgi:hypothetical protein